MFSVCANPDCKATFDYGQGRFFVSTRIIRLARNLRTLIPCNISGCAVYVAMFIRWSTRMGAVS